MLSNTRRNNQPPSSFTPRAFYSGLTTNRTITVHVLIVSTGFQYAKQESPTSKLWYLPASYLNRVLNEYERNHSTRTVLHHLNRALNEYEDHGADGSKSQPRFVSFGHLVVLWACNHFSWPQRWVDIAAKLCAHEPPACNHLSLAPTLGRPQSNCTTWLANWTNYHITINRLSAHEPQTYDTLLVKVMLFRLILYKQ